MSLFPWESATQASQSFARSTRIPSGPLAGRYQQHNISPRKYEPYQKKPQPPQPITGGHPKGKYSKRRRSNVAVIVVRIVFTSSFLFYCLLLNHSFPTIPNKITNCFNYLQLYNYICSSLFWIFETKVKENGNNTKKERCPRICHPATSAANPFSPNLCPVPTVACFQPVVPSRYK